MDSWFSSCAFLPDPNLLQRIYLLSNKTSCHPFLVLYYPKKLFSYSKIPLQEVSEVTFSCLSNSAPYYAKAGLQPGEEDLSVRTGVSVPPWDCIHSQLITLMLSFALKIPKGPIFFPQAKQQGFTG